MMFRSANSAR